MTEKEQAVTKGIAMYPQDWAAIDSFAKDSGINRSSAIRWLVRRWLETEREKQAAQFQNLGTPEPAQ